MQTSVHFHIGSSTSATSGTSISLAVASPIFFFIHKHYPYIAKISVTARHWRPLRQASKARPTLHPTPTAAFSITLRKTPDIFFLFTSPSSCNHLWKKRERGVDVICSLLGTLQGFICCCVWRGHRSEKKSWIVRKHMRWAFWLFIPRFTETIPVFFQYGYWGHIPASRV